VRAFFNLTPDPQPLPATPAHGESILFCSEWTHYCGPRRRETPPDHLLPFEAIVIGPQHLWQPA
jgi:hypothetical protein